MPMELTGVDGLEDPLLAPILIVAILN